MILQVLISWLLIGVYYILFNVYTRRYDTFALMAYSLLLAGFISVLLFWLEDIRWYETFTLWIIVCKILLYSLAFYLYAEWAKRLSDMHTGLMRTLTIVTSLIFWLFMLWKGINLWQGAWVFVIVIATLFWAGSIRKLAQPMDLRWALMAVVAATIWWLTSVLDAFTLREVSPLWNVTYFCLGIGFVFLIAHFIKSSKYRTSPFVRIPPHAVILLATTLLIWDYFLYASFLHGDQSVPGIIIALRKISIVVVGMYWFIRKESDRNMKAFSIIGSIIGFIIISLYS